MFATERLTVAPIHEDHLDDLYAVHVSNPAYLRLTEGTSDGVGVYSKEQMLRDLQVAEWTGRTPLGVFLREGHKLIGFLEFWERAETDGKPWLGLLMIHRDFQRRGFGSEIAKGFLRWAESRGWPEVRIGVLEGNEKVLAFWHSLGFEPYTIKEKRMPSGLKSVVCMRYPISSPKT
jgi:RimJ/RimL family protein N-acetyltransferase